jgi:hypothetical protein
LVSFVTLATVGLRPAQIIQKKDDDRAAVKKITMDFLRLSEKNQLVTTF